MRAGVAGRRIGILVAVSRRRVSCLRLTTWPRCAFPGSSRPGWRPHRPVGPHNTGLTGEPELGGSTGRDSTRPRAARLGAIGAIRRDRRGRGWLDWARLGAIRRDRRGRGRLDWARSARFGAAAGGSTGRDSARPRAAAGGSTGRDRRDSARSARPRAARLGAIGAAAGGRGRLDWARLGPALFVSARCVWGLGRYGLGRPAGFGPVRQQPRGRQLGLTSGFFSSGVAFGPALDRSR